MCSKDIFHQLVNGSCEVSEDSLADVLELCVYSKETESSINSPFFNVNELLCNFNFQKFIKDSFVKFDMNNYFVQLCRCYPELVYFLPRGHGLDALCVHILEQSLNVHDKEELDMLFQRLRILALKVTPQSPPVINGVGNLLIKFVDEFEVCVKLLLLFPYFELFDLVLLQKREFFGFWNKLVTCMVNVESGISQKVLLQLQHEVFTCAICVEDSSYFSKWSLVDEKSKDFVMKYSNLCFSLNQCASNTIEEHMNELEMIVMKCNRGEVSIKWTVLLLSIALQHHSPTVIKQTVHLFSVINWKFIKIEQSDWPIISQFLNQSLMSIIGKQFIYETNPPMSSEIIETLEAILSRNQDTFDVMWNSIIQYNGNYLLKYHYLVVFSKCALNCPNCRKNFRENISAFRENVISFSCIAEPLRTALISASFLCGLLVFDWSVCTLSCFYRFVSVFKHFDKFDLCEVMSFYGQEIRIVLNQLLIESPTIADNTHDNEEKRKISLISMDYESSLDDHTREGAGFYGLQWDYNVASYIQSNFSTDLFTLIPKHCEAYRELTALCDQFKNSGTSLQQDCGSGSMLLLQNLICTFEQMCNDERDYECLSTLLGSVVKKCSEANVLEIVFEMVDNLNETTTNVNVFLMFLKHLVVFGSCKRMSVKERTFDAYERVIELILETKNCESRWSNIDQITTTIQWQTLVDIVRHGKECTEEDCTFKSSFGTEDNEKFCCYLKLTDLALSYLESASMMLVDSILQFLTLSQTVYGDAALFEQTSTLVANNCVLYNRKLTGSLNYHKVFETYIHLLFNSDSLLQPMLASCIERIAFIIMNDCKPSSVLSFTNQVIDTLLTASEESRLFSIKFLQLHNSWFVRMVTVYPITLGNETVMKVLNHSQFDFFKCNSLVKSKTQFYQYKCPKLSIFKLMERISVCNYDDGSNGVCNLVTSFISGDSKLIEELNRRQHINSQNYNQRFRTWTCICKLILSSNSSASEKNKLTELILNAMQNDYSDPSLRVFMEISLSKLISLKEWEKIVNADKLSSFASTYVCSIIHAVGLMFMSNFDSFDSKRVSDVLSFFLNWSTVSHNNIRLSAQAFLIKIWDIIASTSSVVKESGLYTSDNLVFVKSLVEFWKKHDKLIESIEKSNHIMVYYQDIYSFLLDFTCNCIKGGHDGRGDNGKIHETIFNVAYHSVVTRFGVDDGKRSCLNKPIAISQKGVNSNNTNGGSFRNVIDQKQNVSSQSYTKGDFVSNHATSTSETANTNTITTTMQLKPISQLDLDSLFISPHYKLNTNLQLHSVFTNGDNENKETKRGNLIIIASLLEKMTNIGGLSRTAEVQGVEKLVVNSLKSCEMSADFKSLSVTASKWLPIEEVRVNCLPQFLNELFASGYSIVALEQSSHAVSLQKYQFPRKCAILLGNEKMGVPGNFLELYCKTHLEIPQVGTIRSLNVHVAASLLIWEYSKQHVHSLNCFGSINI